MGRFYDSNFGDDDPGPTTGPSFRSLNEDLIDFYNDTVHYQEPGSGDSFSGEDPSVWDGKFSSISDTEIEFFNEYVQLDEQSATVPDGGNSFGRNDDPDAVENTGDLEYGSNENDIPKPEEVISTTDLGEDEPDWQIESYRDLFDETDWLEHNEILYSDLIYLDEEELYKGLLREIENGEAEEIFNTIRNLRDSFALEILNEETDYKIKLLSEAIDTQNDLSDELLFGAMLYANEGLPSKRDIYDYLGVNPPTHSEVLDFFSMPNQQEARDYFGIPTKSDIIEFFTQEEIEEPEILPGFMDILTSSQYDTLAYSFMRGPTNVYTFLDDLVTADHLEYAFSTIDDGLEDDELDVSIIDDLRQFTDLSIRSRLEGL